MNRAINLVFAALLAVVLFVPFLLLGLAVRISIGSPIFFVQERAGFLGRTFRMYKFRSMREPFLLDGVPASDAVRLTNFGRWLRSSSLDELPELINVIKGDMNIVGPRPLLTDYLPRYSTEQARRHEVLPGITGWAQVNGRNSIGWTEKFEFDVWYVNNRSLQLDLRILFMTVHKVFSREGISAVGEATMPSFTGNKKGDQ